MKLRLVFGAALTASAAAALAFAQEAPKSPEAKKEEKPKWDVAAPPLPMRQVGINVDEGTWMDVDVSPDGKTLAFDLLGDIYTMPIAGGTPTRVAEGLPFEMQPQFSPDGKRIAFTSDRGGGDNIWVMNVDGSDKRPLTKEQFRLLNEPSWSPDGRFVAARKHFTTERSLGTGEIWVYSIGGGDGFVAVKRASEALQKELGEPAYSADGTAMPSTVSGAPAGTKALENPSLAASRSLGSMRPTGRIAPDSATSPKNTDPGGRGLSRRADARAAAAARSPAGSAMR